MAHTSVSLYVDHVERGGDMEWDMTAEEVLGGQGRATIRVQDRTNSWVPENTVDVQVVLDTGPVAGHVLFRGEVLSYKMILVPHRAWRTWELTCVDYNYELDWRLIGAFDGKTWLDIAGLGVFVNIDPHAATLRTDKLTIQNWFDSYMRVDGTAIDTTTFVGEYLTDFTVISPSYSKLSDSLDQLAAYVAGNLQFWIDMNLKFHWVMIPAWQDLLAAAVAATIDPSTDTMALMVSSAAGSLVEDLEVAPFGISDASDDETTVGFSENGATFDGGDMVDQVYVRGGTGYVYNAPAIPALDETKTVVSSPVQGADGTYQLTITVADTKLWHVDSTGYVSITYALAATGGPWPVKFIHVAWNAERNKGGYYWKFLSGPHAGLLADDHTNSLNGYGGIRVELITTGSAPPTDPQIGIGGSGWVGEVTQDPNKRQAYLEAPISVTRSMRDSLGGQAVYRGQFPTLRGQSKVTRNDGWRAGQVVPITDSRMPDELNGKYFIIQRVATKLIAGTGEREYTIDWGDGPTSRYSYRSSKAGDVAWPPPVNQLLIDAFDLTPGSASSQTITARLVNALGEPWAIPGKVVEWSFECYNSVGVLQTGQGSITPTVSVTDDHGRAYTTLTTGAGTNLVYYVFARVRAT